MKKYARCKTKNIAVRIIKMPDDDYVPSYIELVNELPNDCIRINEIDGRISWCLNYCSECASQE